jgi:RNA-binding protein NOB1
LPPVEGLSQQVDNLSISPPAQSNPVESDQPPESTEADLIDKPLEPLDVELHPITDDSPSSPSTLPPSHTSEPINPPDSESDSDNPPSPQQLYDDPSDEDDNEGEWITPQNVGIHKSKALDLLPDDHSKSKGPKSKEEEPIGAGCMTADFAMQNVLLQMNLNLVSVDGKRIQKVRNYVLRCHACYK